MSKQIVQIEERIYQQMSKTSKQKWLAMLEKHFGIDKSCGLLVDNYLLQEQTTNDYHNNHLTHSERMVYNIHHSSHTCPQSQHSDSTDNSWESTWMHYDAQNDRYIVQHIHYLCHDEIVVTNRLCEADMPQMGTAHQAPAETTCSKPIVTQKPTSVITNSKQVIETPIPIRVTEEKPQRKRWRKHTLLVLEQLYNKGYSAQEIAREMNVSIEGLKYQLTHYLGYQNIFAKTNSKSQTAAHSVPQVQQPATPKVREFKKWSELKVGDKLKHNVFGDGIIISFTTNQVTSFAVRFEYGIIKSFLFTEETVAKHFTIKAIK